MKRRSVIAILLALLLVFALVGCVAKGDQPSTEISAVDTSAENAADTSAEDVEEPSAAEENTLTIGCTLIDTTMQFYAGLAEGMKQACAEKGYELEVLGCKSEASTQINHIENFIEKGVDVIVIGPVVADAVSDSLKRAQEAGIKVVSYGEAVEYYDSDLIVNNYQGGYLVGQVGADYVNEVLGGRPAKIGYTDVGIAMQICAERKQGIEDAMKELLPEGSEIVGPQTCFTSDEGMNAADAYLQMQPDLDMILCISDGAALGAVEAVKAAGKTSENFAIVGFDATIEALQKIVNDDIMIASIGYAGPAWVGEKLVEMSEEVMAGTAEEHYLIDCEIVDKSNAQEFAADNGYVLN